MNRRGCGQRMVRNRPEPGSFPLRRAETDLIVDAVVDSDRVLIRGSIDPLPRRSHYLGIPPCQTRIEAMTMMVKRSDEHQAAFELLVAELHNPAGCLLPNLFTSEDMASFFGLTENDTAKIVGWMQSQHLEAINVSPARISITFSGPLLAVENAFRTEFHRYRFQDRDYLANAFELSIPAAFAGVVSGFFRPATLAAANTTKHHGRSLNAAFPLRRTS